MWQNEQSTLAQRIALEKMYRALGWKVAGIRDMTKAQASDAFVRCRRAFDDRDRGLDYSDPYSDTPTGTQRPA